jgi:FkbM family methyltransferase
MSEPVIVSHAGREVAFHPDTVRGASIGSFLRRGVFYEAGMLEYIRLLRLTGGYVDAGAAIGTHTLFFAAVCDAARVDSFEPREWVFDLLAENIALNHLESRVTPHMVGLSDRVGHVTTDLDGKAATFPIAPLDACVSTEVEVLKIDVENMETQVVDGAAELLRRSRPVVFAEAWSGAFYDDLVGCMRRHGYAPTGRYFNSTPTFEFWPTSRRRRPVAPASAAAAYGDVPAQPRPEFLPPSAAPSPAAPSARTRVVRALDAHAPRLAAALRALRARARR